MTPERFRGEEAVRQRPGFSHDHGQNRMVLECQPDEVVRDGGRKQPPRGFPERIDISRPVEAEQRPLDYGIDDGFALHIQPSGPNAPILARPPSCLSDFRPRVVSKDLERSEIKNTT
jgi:hypothetical protein